eukprot:1151269-Pelagomonas_calceolata.AAC.3
MLHLIQKPLAASAAVDLSAACPVVCAQLMQMLQPIPKLQPANAAVNPNAACPVVCAQLMQMLQLIPKPQPANAAVNLNAACSVVCAQLMQMLVQMDLAAQQASSKALLLEPGFRSLQDHHHHHHSVTSGEAPEAHQDRHIELCAEKSNKGAVAPYPLALAQGSPHNISSSHESSVQGEGSLGSAGTGGARGAWDARTGGDVSNRHDAVVAASEFATPVRGGVGISERVPTAIKELHAGHSSEAGARETGHTHTREAGRTHSPHTPATLVSSGGSNLQPAALPGHGSLSPEAPQALPHAQQAAAVGTGPATPAEGAGVLAGAQTPLAAAAAAASAGVEELAAKQALGVEQGLSSSGGLQHGSELVGLLGALSRQLQQEAHLMPGERLAYTV